MPALTVDPESVEEFHEYRTLTTAPSGVLIRRNAYPAGRRHRTRFRLIWNMATSTEIETLDAFFRSLNGGAAFTWTPPGGSSGNYRTVDQSLTVARNSSTSNSAELIVEEV
jgi:hypothetical protein